MKIGKDWELLAHVGVDSGQLMVVDPCNIDSRWQRREFRDIRRFYNAKLDRYLQYRVDFERFDEVMPEFGKDMNALIATGEWVKVADSISNSLDYEAACLTTLQESGGGELADGLAAAFSTGYGDGEYPVYVKRRGGRIAQVLIDFGMEEEE